MVICATGAVSETGTMPRATGTSPGTSPAPVHDISWPLGSSSTM